MVRRNLEIDRRTLLRSLGASALAASTLGAGQAFAQASRSVLIRGGLVVNAHGREEADVLIQGEKIVQVGKRLTPPDRRTRIIDARGLQVFPGAIDPHVHTDTSNLLIPPFADDFETASKAALAGGITTIGVMAFNQEGETLSRMMERCAADVARQAIADVMLHPVLGMPPQVDEMSHLASEGYTTLKIFSIDGDFDKEYPKYIQALEKARELGILPLLHCEDQKIMDAAQRHLISQGKRSLEFYEESRPVVAEVLSTQKAMMLCEVTGCPVYIVHLSSERALRVCEEAQARGLPVYVEGRPIYLHHTSKVYKSPDAPLFVSMPPIRAASDQEALWKGVIGGSIHTLGSDHAPYFKKDKLDPKHDIVDPLAGSRNLQEMLPVFYSEGVLKGRVSLERFVQLTSAHVAKLFGLYPRKGVVQAGADADIIVWDPARKTTMRHADSYSRVDFSIYDGWEVTGAPRFTLRRGEVVCENGRITAKPGSGQSLKRARWQAFQA